jgi:hypothetical protein
MTFEPTIRPALGTTAVAVDARRGDGSRRLAASHAQQALWFLHRLDPTSPAYHTGAALLVHAPLDPGALERGLIRLADRHDMLRSTFHLTAGVVERRVHTVAQFDLDVRPAPDLDADQLRELARQTLNLPFRLEEAVFRFVLFRLSAERSLLVMAAHHIATDAWSNWVLIRDLLEFYQQEASRHPVEPPGLTGTFEDFVQREAELLASHRYRELVFHWQGICAGAVPGELPVDYGRAVSTGVGATYRLRLDSDEVAALRAAAAGCDVTTFAFLLGCFQALVGIYGRQRAFLIGCPTSARHGARTRDVVGNFVNTLLFRAEVSRRTTFRDLATDAYRQVGDGMRAVGLPFSLLPHVVRPARQAGTAPLCRITFNLIGTAHPDPLLRRLLDPDAGGGPVAHAGLMLEPIPVPQSEGQLDLAVHVQQSRDSLTVEFRYDTGLFELESVQRLAVHYRRLLAAAAAQPDRPMARTSLVNHEELTDLMGEAPATDLTDER